MEIHEIAQPDGSVSYDVTLHERQIEDIKRLRKNDRVDEKPFEAVAALSELNERAYSLLVRPFVREMVPEWLARTMRELHPLRAERWMISDRNPWLWALPHAAAAVHRARRPRNDDAPAVAAERFASESIVAALDLYRDLRDAASEAAFFQVYGNMLTLSMADEGLAMRRQARFDPRALPAVRQVLETIDEGGRREALARIAMLITRAGSGKHKLSQMQRVRELVDHDRGAEPMSEDERRRLLQEETIVVEFEPVRAKRSLPRLLRTAADRRAARTMLDRVETYSMLDERQRELVAELRSLLPPTGSERGAAATARTRKRAAAAALPPSRKRVAAAAPGSSRKRATAVTPPSSRKRVS
jgi:hypothetical protein